MTTLTLENPDVSSRSSLIPLLRCRGGVLNIVSSDVELVARYLDKQRATVDAERRTVITWSSVFGFKDCGDFLGEKPQYRSVQDGLISLFSTPENAGKLFIFNGVDKLFNRYPEILLLIDEVKRYFMGSSNMLVLVTKETISHPDIVPSYLSYNFPLPSAEEIGARIDLGVEDIKEEGLTTAEDYTEAVRDELVSLLLGYSMRDIENLLSLGLAQSLSGVELGKPLVEAVRGVIQNSN